uniref:Uncharacterized protein n=1 Tax=Ixodes ricinus TaxID=34613 RepID=A0A6B0UPI5_IXORI
MPPWWKPNPPRPSIFSSLPSLAPASPFLAASSAFLAASSAFFAASSAKARHAMAAKSAMKKILILKFSCVRDMGDSLKHFWPPWRAWPLPKKPQRRLMMPLRRPTKPLRRATQVLRTARTKK